MKLPIVKSLHIENFTGTAITNADYFNKNAIIGQYDDERIYATQRPSIDIFDEADPAGSDMKGRGIYFWDKANDRYIVDNDKVYKGSIGNVIGNIDPGTDKVYFVEMVNWLVIIDPQGNKGYYIQNTGTFDTLVQIIDLAFPPNQTPALQLIAGGAFLDGRLYVGTKDAKIWGSDANTPVTWELLNFVSAEREADDGVYVDKHHDHIVMFGTRTIEFFYNNANPPPGSPLSRRRDVFHNTGMMQGDAAWREGDDIYFVGVYPSGPLQVLSLRQFQTVKVSTPEIESFITNARLVEDSNFTSSGFTSGNRSYYIITFYRIIGGLISPNISIVFDGISWGVWDTTVCSCNRFPLVGWTIRSGSDANSGEGIFSTCDLLTIKDDFVPVDTVLSTAYIMSGYIQDGYYTASGGAGENIIMTVRTGPFDGDTNKWKFGHSLEIVGDETENDITADISWSDGNSLDFGPARTVNLSRKEKVTRLGRFKRRNHQMVFDVPEQYRVEAIELEATEGGH